MTAVSLRRSTAGFGSAWAPCVAAPLCLLALLNVCAAPAQASVLQPGSLPVVDLAFLVRDEGGTSGAQKSPARQVPAPPPAPRHNDVVYVADNVKGPGQDGGSGSTSTSSPVNLGGGFVSIIASRAIVVNDDAAYSELWDSIAFSLPAPPGVDLLRPPRVTAVAAV